MPLASALALKDVRPLIPMKTAIEIYKGLIEPHCDDCSVVWDGLSQQLSEDIRKLQNRAPRVITKSSFDTNSSCLLNSLSWDTLLIRKVKQKAYCTSALISSPQIIFVMCNQELQTT